MEFNVFNSGGSQICLDNPHHVWFMLHNGSRGIGNRMGTCTRKPHVLEGP
jgi:hypothetical protein